jgi:hypothetical protein
MARAYHPPKPSPYEAPTEDCPGYLIGATGVQGFGKKDLYLAAIPAARARETIVARHYSRRVVNNSYVHLGVYHQGLFRGVLQFGYALNPRCAGKVVEGTDVGEYLELNRMWLDDACPRNTESQSISYALKYIRQACPTVAWVQSFADERCGGLGVVYQASNFQYCGSHLTTFWHLDGEWYHEMMLTAHRKAGQRGEYLRANLSRATRHRFRQFRYVLFLKQSWRKRLRLPVLPYPKRGTA